MPNRSKVNDARFWNLWKRSGAVAPVAVPLAGVDIIASIDYKRLAVTAEYKCAKCGATGCKLWREYQTCAPTLLCCDCAAKHQKKDISSMGEDGLYESDYGKCDQIGWYVPAVPDEEGMGYWGYTSVPQTGCDWWRRLPTRPKQPLAA